MFGRQSIGDLEQRAQMSGSNDQIFILRIDVRERVLLVHFMCPEFQRAIGRRMRHFLVGSQMRTGAILVGQCALIGENKEIDRFIVVDQIRPGVFGNDGRDLAIVQDQNQLHQFLMAELLLPQYEGV